MPKSPQLKSAKKALSNLGFNVQYQSDNSLTVYYPDDNVPFLFIIQDLTEFNGIILNFACDYPVVLEAVDIVINLMHVCPVTTGDIFYFDKKGSLLTGESAMLQFEADNGQSILATMEPTSNAKH